MSATFSFYIYPNVKLLMHEDHIWIEERSFPIDKGKKPSVLLPMSSRETQSSTDKQGGIKNRETTATENEVGRKRINKSQEEESSHKFIWKVLAQVSLHRMADGGIELRFVKVTRDTKNNFSCSDRSLHFSLCWWTPSSATSDFAAVNSVCAWNKAIGSNKRNSEVVFILSAAI